MGAAVAAIVGSSVLVIAMIVGLVWWLRRRIAECRVELDAIAGGRTPLRIDERVNCFGRESLGRTQARGNGFLALFADEIVFVQWVPKRSFRIRLDRIITVDEVKGFLGKTVGRPLLRVAWRDPEGRDIAVWWLNDLQAWISAIEDARKGATAESDVGS